VTVLIDALIGSLVAHRVTRAALVGGFQVAGARLAVPKALTVAPPTRLFRRGEGVATRTDPSIWALPEISA